MNYQFKHDTPPKLFSAIYPLYDLFENVMFYCFSNTFLMMCIFFCFQESNLCLTASLLEGSDLKKSYNLKNYGNILKNNIHPKGISILYNKNL